MHTHTTQSDCFYSVTLIRSEGLLIDKKPPDWIKVTRSGGFHHHKTLRLGNFDPVWWFLITVKSPGLMVFQHLTRSDGFSSL